MNKHLWRFESAFHPSGSGRKTVFVVADKFETAVAYAKQSLGELEIENVIQMTKFGDKVVIA